MPADDFDELLASALAGRSAEQLLRQRTPLRPLDAAHVAIGGVRYVNFSSNNYLGLSHHPRVIEAIARAAREFGAGSAASPLITGHTTLHAGAEAALARWKGTESAVLLPSGYQANHAAIQTIGWVAICWQCALLWPPQVTAMSRSPRSTAATSLAPRSTRASTRNLG